jgi:hypothetical protein
VVSSKEEPESLRILRALPGGHCVGARRTREERTIKCSVGREKKLYPEGIESVCRQAQKKKRTL